jgi:hypothetical protein
LPGLSAALQVKVAAKSDAAMTGGTREVSVVTKEALAKAREGLVSELSGLLRKKIQEVLQKEDVVNIAYLDEIVKQESSRAEGEEVQSFNFKVRLRVVGVSWGKDLVSRAAGILETLYPSGKELVANNLQNLQPEIQKYNEAQGTAIIKVSVQGTVIPTTGYELLDPGHFVGMSKAEIERYLFDKKLAESVVIKFFPFWIKKAPMSVNNIKIVLDR